MDVEIREKNYENTFYASMKNYDIQFNHLVRNNVTRYEHPLVPGNDNEKTVTTRRLFVTPPSTHLRRTSSSFHTPLWTSHFAPLRQAQPEPYMFPKVRSRRVLLLSGISMYFVHIYTLGEERGFVCFRFFSPMGRGGEERRRVGRRVVGGRPCDPWRHLHRANQHLVLEHERHGDEDEVEEEHGEAEASVHAPFEAGDAEDHEEEHAEEDGYAADHTHRVDFDGFSVDYSENEPWDRKPAEKSHIVH